MSNRSTYCSSSEWRCPLSLHRVAYRPLDTSETTAATRRIFAATEHCDWRGRVLSGEVHDANAWAHGGRCRACRPVCHRRRGVGIRTRHA